LPALSEQDYRWSEETVLFRLLRHATVTVGQIRQRLEIIFLGDTSFADGIGHDPHKLFDKVAVAEI
jgi:hypothetical protein